MKGDSDKIYQAFQNLHPGKNAENEPGMTMHSEDSNGKGNLSGTEHLAVTQGIGKPITCALLGGKALPQIKGFVELCASHVVYDPGFSNADW